MGKMHTPQLSQIIDHTSPAAMMREAAKIFCYHYRPSSFRVIHHACFWVSRLFSGGFTGYKACNTEYHDLSHTMDVFLASARLADGHNLERNVLSEELVLDLYLAALLHDVGYIQQENDLQGTGAKYTETHVERSVEFVFSNARVMKIPPRRVETVSRLIKATNISHSCEEGDFSGEDERTAGTLIATADLLGQMADRKYLEKLIFLYREMKEAGMGDFKSEFDILKSTMGFYALARERLETTLRGMYGRAAVHFQKRYGVSKNLYM
jgi:hypothetical protein